MELMRAWAELTNLRGYHLSVCEVSMGCCTTEGTSRYFDRSVRRFAKRALKGLDRVQELIIDGMGAMGLQGKDILEIGCGVGALHHAMLERGAAAATGTELSDEMVSQARAFAREKGLDHRTRYVKGDVTRMTEGPGTADIVLLDKVLCCYGEPLHLLRSVMSRARSFLCVSYPRDALFARIGFRASELAGKIFRMSFHPYYHDPMVLNQFIREGGFEEVYSGNTIIWQVKIYSKRVNEAGV